MSDSDKRLTNSLVERDRKVVWHPLTQHGIEPAPLPVVAAEGSRLILEDGRELIDAISSWWCCLHGHGRSELVEAMRDQAGRLDHVLFAGTTHEPAVGLAEALLEIVPAGLSRVFYSDNGSTAIEVALKMVWQMWEQRGETSRHTFVTLEGSYHGDTVGAMSVGDPDPYFLPFTKMTFPVRRVSVDEASVDHALAELGRNAAGVIIEPLVQGAAGMVMHSPTTVRAIRDACDRHQVPLIADEVMTGFGRTGSLFACEQAGISPDFLCLSKGITGGVLPLAATLAREESFDAFVSDQRTKAFFHGHTFTGNPIACAVALASLRLVIAEDVPTRLDRIGRQIEERIADNVGSTQPAIKLRRTGGIVAIEPTRHERAGYFASSALKIRSAAIERGVLLRPLGPVIYAIPPASTTSAECDQIADVMCDMIRLTN